ncbi:hypothetical protein KQ302_01320 [Synechococcus sp. CS-602]|uniref:GNAT family N-acetyltransferase n=1 Tax=Synechococcaceae TaxID=1890426 RepID=UPI0008FF62F8|nr:MULTISPECIES: GNAT family N-acetyltransferase [Synechococcaceae]MCT4364312.1 GNAT family N-acetyltransferase [Candidatus Regnicoccus frigidus MAG-AL1]APD48886.1 hypothetical protein BM449_12335 [Synechococcus sp. SynAce01]MCT0202368.1 hypothetical protein [Synechococcus sp. CS-603]MCT0203760.1 hypothetical protein [Synechococcus sp. CS-602]MCT0246449.1 hypothetical protein [Synechococcus sp. CS-601]
MTLVELSRQLMGHGFACLGESDGSWFQQGEAGWFASGIPHPCANTVLSAGPDWNYASLAEIAGHFHARGVPCSWLCWPDQQPLEQGQHLLALGYRPVAAAALMAAPTAALLATTPNPGQRLAAALPGAELLPLGPSFRQAYAVCASVSTGAPQAFGARAAAALLGSGTAGSPLTYGVLHGGELLAVATSVVVGSVGAIFWVGTLPAWRRCGLARAVTAAAIAAGAARGARLTLLQAGDNAEGLYAAMGFRRHGRTEIFVRSEVDQYSR